jgi:hypothetical protein
VKLFLINPCKKKFMRTIAVSLTALEAPAIDISNTSPVEQQLDFTE